MRTTLAVLLALATLWIPTLGTPHVHVERARPADASPERGGDVHHAHGVGLHHRHAPGHEEHPAGEEHASGPAEHQENAQSPEAPETRNLEASRAGILQRSPESSPSELRAGRSRERPSGDAVSRLRIRARTSPPGARIALAARIDPAPDLRGDSPPLPRRGPPAPSVLGLAQG